MQTIHLCYKQDRIAAVHVSDDPYYTLGTNMNKVYDDIRTIDGAWERIRNYIEDEGYKLYHVSDGYDNKQQCSFSVFRPE